MILYNQILKIKVFPLRYTVFKLFCNTFIYHFVSAYKSMFCLLSSDTKVLHLEGPKQDYREIVFIFAWGIIFRLVSSVLYISKCELTT